MNTFFLTIINGLNATPDSSVSGGTTGGCDATSLIFYGILIAVVVGFFFFSSRSKKKQEKQVTDMMEGLRVGDEITTIGGIVGRIVSIKEDTVVIETSRDGTKIRFLKSSISKVEVPVESTKDTDTNKK